MSEKGLRYAEISRNHGDPWIWGIYIMLVIISVVESYSASSREIASQGVYAPIIKQCVFLAVGACIVWGMKKVNYSNKRWILAYVPGLCLVTVLSMVYVMMFGEIINGAQRAISLPGGLSLQPAELAKVSVVTILAYITSRTLRNRDVSNKGVIISAVIVTVYGGLLVTSGLTNALLIMSISLAMLLMGGVRLKKLAVLVLVYIAVFGVYKMIENNNEKKAENLRQAEAVFTTDSIADASTVANASQQASKQQGVDRSETRSNRISEWRFMNKGLLKDSIKSENHQVMFSRMAQAHGGLYGVGIGNSRECSRLPLAFSDYIFSIIVEETGLIGGVIVMMLYLLLLARTMMIVRKCHRALPALLIIGMAAMICFQALFHMAINTGVFPVSGQPLPLISRGGTSILVISFAFGMMISISRTIANQDVNKGKPDQQLPKELEAENPTQID